jgi:hypothetical protein
MAGEPGSAAVVSQMAKNLGRISAGSLRAGSLWNTTKPAVKATGGAGILPIPSKGLHQHAMLANGGSFVSSQLEVC